MRPDPAAYFTGFLPGLMHRLLIDGLEGLSACFDIEVAGCGKPWRLVVESGRLVAVAHDGPPPACRFRVQPDALWDVVRARCTPAEAFFASRIEIEGDVETGLKLSTVLEPFFARFPYPA